MAAATESLFKALADTTRRRILCALSAHQLSVTELVEVLGQPQSTVSRHLKVLRDSGLLVERRHGSTVLHSTCPVVPELPADGDSSGTVLGGNGAGISGLRNRLLSWISSQPMEREFRDRLDRVIRSRKPEAEGFFDAVGARWDQLRIEAFGDVFHLEAFSLLLPRTWIVADVGTGTGYLLSFLGARFDRVIAVDASQSMLEAARHRPELAGVQNVEFRPGTLEALPISDGEVDLIIASLVLHHVPEPRTALAELRRCVRAGGSLLLVEHEQHHLAEFHGRMGDCWWGFEPATLVDWVSRAGFESIRVHSLSTARSSARRAMESPRLFAIVAS